MWELKERDWQKDLEILKVSANHNTEWMQRAQLSLAEMKDEMKNFKNDVNSLTGNSLAESVSLR